MKRKIQMRAVSKICKAVVLVIATLTLSTVAAESPVTLDTADSAENSEMQNLLDQEQVYLERVKQDLSVFQQDQVHAALGTIYLQKKEYGKALKYLEKVGASWELNKKSVVISRASFNLAMIYVHGKGIAKDYPKAFAAFARATWGGNEPAGRELYVMCRDKEVSAEMIRDFTVKNFNYYIVGVGHSLYEASTSNLQFMYACDSERAFIDEMLDKNRAWGQ